MIGERRTPHCVMRNGASTFAIYGKNVLRSP